MEFKIPENASDTVEATARKPYSAPRLEQLGDVRELTLGGSPGAGDSGSAMTRKTPMM